MYMYFQNILPDLNHTEVPYTHVNQILALQYPFLSKKDRNDQYKIGRLVQSSWIFNRYC